MQEISSRKFSLKRNYSADARIIIFRHLGDFKWLLKDRGVSLARMMELSVDSLATVLTDPAGSETKAILFPGSRPQM